MDDDAHKRIGVDHRVGRAPPRRRHWGAAVLVRVFPYHTLHDAEDPELISLRAEDTLLEHGGAEGLEIADARVIADNVAARELQRITEQPDSGLTSWVPRHAGQSVGCWSAG